jgi:hypothetical protein
VLSALHVWDPISLSHDDEYPPFLGGIQSSLTNGNADMQLKQCEKQFIKIN